MLRGQGLRVIAVVSALALLAGCSASHKKNIDATTTTSNGIDATSAQTYGVSSAVSIQTDANGRVINAMNAPANQTYYFSFDNSSISDQDMRALMVQANYLVNHPSSSVRLEGNADARGSREYNIGLGWRRDQTVARILEQQGVKPSQIDMVSFGKEKPAVMGDNEQAWSLNRRVELVYEKTS